MTLGRHLCRQVAELNPWQTQGDAGDLVTPIFYSNTQAVTCKCPAPSPDFKFWLYFLFYDKILSMLSRTVFRSRSSQGAGEARGFHKANPNLPVSCNLHSQRPAAAVPQAGHSLLMGMHLLNICSCQRLC